MRKLLFFFKRKKKGKKNKQSGILSNKKNTKIEHTGSEELFLWPNLFFNQNSVFKVLNFFFLPSHILFLLDIMKKQLSLTHITFYIRQYIMINISITIISATKNRTKTDMKTAIVFHDCELFSDYHFPISLWLLNLFLRPLNIWTLTIMLVLMLIINLNPYWRSWHSRETNEVYQSFHILFHSWIKWFYCQLF